MADLKKKYKVVYDRAGCIGVLTCSAFYPERWAISKDDAKADLVGGVEDKTSPGIWLLEFTEEELERFKLSAESCPVAVIHIYDVETNEKKCDC